MKRHCLNRISSSILTVVTSIALYLMVGNALAAPPRLTHEEIIETPPKVIRFCCSFGADVGIVALPFVKKTDITSREKIGPHHYLGKGEEGNGIIYTCRGGFLDLGHLRDYVDWTAWLYCRINYSLEQHLPSDTIELRREGGSKTLVLNLATDTTNIDWFELAGKIAYEISLWHEIATWFGVSYVPLVPERFSSFSPEDLYSNLLGVRIGIRALKSNLEYNEAVTQILSNMLDSLQAVNSENETYQAMENVEYLWWTNKKKLPTKNVVLKRYLDSDTFLEPWLIPQGLAPHKPWFLYKPGINLPDVYELIIKLNYKFPNKTLFPDSGKHEITQKDFKKLMNIIQKEVNSTS